MRETLQTEIWRHIEIKVVLKSEVKQLTNHNNVTEKVRKYKEAQMSTAERCFCHPEREREREMVDVHPHLL